MADELRPYIFGASPSSSVAGAAGADAAEGGDVEEGEISGSSSGGDGLCPLLTISDINPDMLEVNGLTCVFILLVIAFLLVRFFSF